jgi:hypothetical protein
VIPNRQEELERFLARHFPKPAPKHEANGSAHGRESSPPMGDEEVLKLCRKASNAPKFASLYDDGDLSGYDGDDSAADAGLLGILAFYTQEPDKLERLWGQSALGQREKFRTRHDYRRRTINYILDNLTETYCPLGDGARPPQNLSSLNDSLKESDDDYRSGEVPGLVCFAHRPVPDPVGYLLEKAVPLGYVTNLHGAGGFGKSVLAMLVALSVSGYQKECLGLAVHKCGKVLYLDSELDERGQHPRVREICKGLGIPVPEGLYYLSALGLDTAEAFGLAYRACKKLEITLLVIDSWGPLMDGNMESAQDIIKFYNNHLKPLVDLGVTVLIVDHQSRTQEGQNYQKKGAFGSVYKENLARSVLQIERVEEDRDAGTLRVRVRHRKSNFGPRLEPFDVTITFGGDRIITKAEAIEEAEKASEESLNSSDRIFSVLIQEPATVKEIVARTGLAEGTVRNGLSKLVPGRVHTGELDGRTKVYGLPDDIKNLSSLSSTYRCSDNDDRSAEEKTPVSSDLGAGESATVAELRKHRERKEGDPLAEFLENPPEWFLTQGRLCAQQGAPERLLNPLANSVATHLFGSPWQWQEVLPAVEEKLQELLGGAS